MKIRLELKDVLDLVLEALTANDVSGEPHWYLPSSMTRNVRGLVAEWTVNEHQDITGIEVSVEDKDE